VFGLPKHIKAVGGEFEDAEEHGSEKILIRNPTGGSEGGGRIDPNSGPAERAREMNGEKIQHSS